MGTARAMSVLGAALSMMTSCGDRRKTDDAPAPAPTTSASAPAPDAPRGPLSIVLESRGEIAFSGVENGVVVADQARARLARAVGAGELTDQPMPSGLPAGSGRVLRAAGRLPNSLWLSYEKLRDDGKPEAHPLFRLNREGWKMWADDWKPAISAWSKNRILAASTSSGRLKIKIIEPSVPRPPDDLPSARLADASCEKSLVVADLAALRTGEVIAAGTCKPDTAAGAGASAKRYVVIRWPGASAADAGAPPIASAAPAVSAALPVASAAPPAASASLDAGSTGADDAGAASASDAGASDAGALDAGAADTASTHAGASADEAPSGPVGVVDVVPGVSTELSHRALFARSASDVWAAAFDPSARPPASRLFHFDGTTWGAEALPAGAAVVRGLAGTADGTLWLVTDRVIWKKPASAAWEQVPPPLEGAWELLDVRVVGDADVWIAGRVRAAGGSRDVVMRTRSAPVVVKWN